MDSDEVEKITETIESQQVVDIIFETHEEILDRRTWEFTLHRPRQLDTPAVSVVTNLDIPSDVMHVEEVRYKNFDTVRFDLISYLAPDKFVEETSRRDVTQAQYENITVNDGVVLVVFNDRVPRFWTSFDENIITFDAYDKANEAAVTAANSSILAQVRPTFTQSDTFVAAWPEQMFTLLLHEAKSSCWIQLKQEGNPKSEQIARRQYIKLRELERRTVKDKDVVDYSRRSPSFNRNHLLFNNKRR